VVRRLVENNQRRITDYHLLRVIGTGTFGKVYLALLDGKPVALKALKKTQIINLKQVDHIKLEKSLLAQIYHPFIVNL
jgi:serine/threonine protein kinase